MYFRHGAHLSGKPPIGDNMPRVRPSALIAPSVPCGLLVAPESLSDSRRNGREMLVGPRQGRPSRPA